MQKALVLTVMTGLAVVLTGCGGGGGDSKKPNTNYAEFVSQTVTGNMKATVQIESVSMSFSGNMVLHVDADELDIRMDATLTFMGNASNTATMGALVSAGKKSATGYASGETQIPGLPAKACRVEVLQTIPAVETLKAVLKGELASHRPNGMDGDYRQWVFNAMQMGATVQETIALDDNNGLRKLDMVLHSKDESMTFSFAATDVKIQKPDASTFEVPKDWEPCTPMPNSTALFDRLQSVLPLLVLPSQEEQAAQAQTSQKNMMVI